MKIFSTSLIIRGMQIKSQYLSNTSHQSNGYHQKNPKTINAGESVEGREPSYTTGGNVNWCSYYREVWRCLKKLKTDLAYDPAIPFLSIYPEKTLISKDTSTPMFTAVVFTVAKHGNNLNVHQQRNE